MERAGVTIYENVVLTAVSLDSLSTQQIAPFNLIIKNLILVKVHIWSIILPSWPEDVIIISKHVLTNKAIILWF
jgi:hypothetical protein